MENLRRALKGEGEFGGGRICGVRFFEVTGKRLEPPHEDAKPTPLPVRGGVRGRDSEASFPRMEGEGGGRVRVLKLQRVPNYRRVW